MKNIDFTIVTPSYHLDFVRCQLLSQSIRYFIEPKVNHYIIVHREDLELFRPLETKNTQIITVESIIPWWIKRLPGFDKGWLSFKTLPIRNWLMQQIIKIIAAQDIAKDVVVFIDSDVVFVRPFQLNNFVDSEGKIRLFKDPIGNEAQKKIQYKWHATSTKLLGLSEIEPTLPDYIGQIITWKKDHVIQMCDRIEAVSGKCWIETLANSWNVSEYILYGTFIERVLGDKSLHYSEALNICHDYWFQDSLSTEELEEFITQINSQQVAIMVSSKAKIPVERYYPLLQKYFEGF